MDKMALTGIAVRPARRADMILLEQCEVTCEEGLAGDHLSRPSSRQLTILSEENWLEACRELGTELPWQTRRANLLIRGYRFGWNDVGRHLKIGTLVLKITRETTPCRRMDEQQQGLMSALSTNWRGGVCCRVIHGGVIRLGDSIEIFPPESDPG